MSTTTETTGKALAELRGHGKQMAKQAGGTTVAAFFEANKKAIGAVLPKHMTPERMIKIALRCLRVTPKLMDCTLDSLVGATITCAQMGLEPNTPQGHIYLIPFWNGRRKIMEVQVIVGYKGLIDLARRSGEIESISSRVVYENDEVFSIDYGTEDRIVHKPCLHGDPGEIIGFYAVAKLKGGGTQFEYMPVSAVNRIRDSSQGYIQAMKNGSTNTPWIANYEQMGRKTPLRRICNYLPMSIELAGAIDLDGKGDNGMQDMGAVLDGVDYTETPSQNEPPQDAGKQEPPRLTEEVTITPDLTGKIRPDAERVEVRREEPSAAERGLQEALARGEASKAAARSEPTPEPRQEAPDPKAEPRRDAEQPGMDLGEARKPSAPPTADKDDSGFGTGE